MICLRSHLDKQKKLTLKHNSELHKQKQMLAIEGNSGTGPILTRTRSRTQEKDDRKATRPPTVVAYEGTANKVKRVSFRVSKDAGMSTVNHTGAANTSVNSRLMSSRHSKSRRSRIE